MHKCVAEVILKQSFKCAKADVMEKKTNHDDDWLLISARHTDNTRNQNSHTDFQKS